MLLWKMGKIFLLLLLHGTPLGCAYVQRAKFSTSCSACCTCFKKTKSGLHRSDLNLKLPAGLCLAIRCDGKSLKTFEKFKSPGSREGTMAQRFQLLWLTSSGCTNMWKGDWTATSSTHLSCHFFTRDGKWVSQRCCCCCSTYIFSSWSRYTWCEQTQRNDIQLPHFKRLAAYWSCFWGEVLSHFKNRARFFLDPAYTIPKHYVETFSPSMYNVHRQYLSSGNGMEQNISCGACRLLSAILS